MPADSPMAIVQQRQAKIKVTMSEFYPLGKPVVI